MRFDRSAAGDARPMRTPSVLLVGLLCGAIMIIDGYDLGAMPLIVPHVARLWDIAPAVFGPALSAVVIGLGIGAVLLAPFGDRYGRRPAIIASLVVIAAATMGTAFAASPAQFFWWRLLTGLGLGACLPNVTATLAELVPHRRRASFVTLVSCGIPVGGIAAAFAVPMLVARLGWPAAFGVPAAMMLGIALLAFVLLPETAGVRTNAGSSAPHRIGALILAPLSSAFLFRTLIFWGLFAFNSFTLYMLASWLPTLLTEARFSFADASRLSAAIQGGGLVGGMIIASQLDKHRTVATLLCGYAVAALSLAGLTIVPPGILAWGILLALIGGGIAGVHIALTAVGASFYPPPMLSAGLGLAVAVARLGAVAGPLVGAFVVHQQYSSSAFFLLLLLPIGVCAACVALIPVMVRRNGQLF